MTDMNFSFTKNLSKNYQVYSSNCLFPQADFFSICSTERPPFPCGKTSNNTLDCLGFADDKAVFYEATVNMCTQPATVTLRVSQPETNFNYVGTFYKSVNPPMQIGVYNNELVFSFFP